MARLSDGEIEQALASGPWRHDGDTIVREVELGGFKAAMALANRVADAANEANHHPDILIHGWNRVRLTLSTHSAGSLTDADFALARAIDGL